MKVKSSKDSTGEKKISLIDELSARISYNMAAKTKRWSNLNTNLRLKLWKNYTFSMSAVFATYAYKYDDNGNVIEGDRTEWSYGRFGRFQGMSQNISYTFNNQTFKKLFGKKKEEESTDIDDINSAIEAPEEDYVDEETTDSNVDPTLTQSQNSAKKEKGKSRIDDDGYKRFEIPWSLSVSYGISMREDRSRKINPKTMRYPFSYTQSLNFSGNIRISDGCHRTFDIDRWLHGIFCSNLIFIFPLRPNFTNDSCTFMSYDNWMFADIIVDSLMFCSLNRFFVSRHADTVSDQFH